MRKLIQYLYKMVIFLKPAQHWFNLYIVPLLVFSIIVSCTSDRNIAGTSSGVETKVAQGSIVKENGTVAAHTLVQLIPVNYDPVSSTILPQSTKGITNDNGNYELTAPDTGLYNIQADFNDSSRLLIRAIHIASANTLIPVGMLHLPGSIKVILPTETNRVDGYLYLPGTDIFVYFKGTDDSIIIKSVPAADYQSINYAKVNSTTHIILQNDITVRPGDTTVVALYDWKYYKSVYFNTTAAGAGISSTIINAPLLIRLDTTNFDFSQARTHGEDIRFTKKNGFPLPYEIEQWDSASARAAIWVKVDTLSGNDSSQSILMHWGNSNAADESDSRKVFDTSAGFKGVWHLSNNENRIPDATANKFDGTRKGNQSSCTGVIGLGQHLDGAGDFTEMGDVCNPGNSNFTFCGWIRKFSSSKRQTLISKSNGGSPSSDYGWLIDIDPDGAVFLFMANAAGSWGVSGSFVIASSKTITDTAWHYVAVVADRSGEDKSRIYFDGSDVSSLPTKGIMTLGEIVNTFPLRIGADANGNNNYNGYLDEISISYLARSSDYIKLSYENQKPGSKLIHFK